jgi:hypothetical protein
MVRDPTRGAFFAGGPSAVGMKTPSVTHGRHDGVKKMGCGLRHVAIVAGRADA